MVFGLIRSVVNTAVDVVEDVVEDAVDISLNIVTLGEYGELSRSNVSRLVAGGMTLAMIAGATGVALHVLEDIMD